MRRLLTFAGVATLAKYGAENMSQSTRDAVVQEIARHQARLRGLVRCLLVQPSDVDDLLQEVNLVLWEKIDGQLSAEEAAELNALVQSDESRMDRAVDQLLLDSLLIEAIGKEPLTALVDLVAAGPAPGDVETQPEPAPRHLMWRAGGPRRLWRPAGWLVAAAVVLVAVFLIGRWQSSALASPSSLVRAAIETHRQRVERVYVVTVEPNLPPVPGGTAPRDVRVATQGDRFWLEMTRGETRWVWGRDPDGAIWLTVGSQRAIRIEPDEVGPALQSVSDVYCLEWETLLNNVLKNCRLKRSAESDSSYAITATPSWLWRNRVRVREMTIECDRETRAIRRLVVHRQVPPHGEVTTTFTLVDARPADASRYRPEGHLIAPYEILSRDSNDARRQEVLSNWFGPETDRWIKPERQPPSPGPRS
jgi:hypothetical protein